MLRGVLFPDGLSLWFYQEFYFIYFILSSPVVQNTLELLHSNVNADGLFRQDFVDRLDDDDDVEKERSW